MRHASHMTAPQAAATGRFLRSLRLACRLATGLTGLALLSACAGSGGVSGSRQAAGPSTGYYVSHAAGNYAPPGPPGDPWGPYVQLAASRFDVPARWIRQVMHVESGGHEYINGQLTVSSAGAMGLMQLEPETYQEMANRYGLGSDPFNPYDNIMAGTAYIHEMYEVYGSPGFLAAYNAGPGRLDSFMNYSNPLPDATINYIAMIAPKIQGYYPAHRSEADQLALNTEPAGVSTGILPAGYDPDAPAADTMEVAYAAPPQAAFQSAAAPPVPAEVATVPTPAPAPTPTPQPAPVAPVEVAALAVPAPTPESALYTPQPVSSEPEPAPPAPEPRFSLIQPAMADTPPLQTQSQEPTSSHVGWAIQVGAYSSRNSANAALGIAELSAVQVLMHGQPMVMSFASASGTKYRARFTGLPHDNAVDACQRLAGGPTGCVVLSPEAQS